MKINVVKAEGTKNHFLIIKENLKNKDLNRIFKKAMSVTNYTRIDGFLVLSPSKKADFKMDYYNNERTHQGKRCKGKTPMQTLLEGKQIWMDKFVDQI